MHYTWKSCTPPLISAQLSLTALLIMCGNRLQHIWISMCRFCTKSQRQSDLLGTVCKWINDVITASKQPEFKEKVTVKYMDISKKTAKQWKHCQRFVEMCLLRAHKHGNCVLLIKPYILIPKILTNWILFLQLTTF